MEEPQAENLVPCKAPLQVLILEDNPRDVELMVATLRRVGYAVTFDGVDSPASFRQHLEQAQYDIILADFNLQTWNAMDALGILRQTGKNIPFVVATGTLGDEGAAECIKQGATDYVLKEHLDRLPLVVERALSEKAQREEAARLVQQICRAKKEWESTFDAVPDPVLLLDADFRIKRVNRATAELLGLSFSQLIGGLCYEVVHGRSDPIPTCPHRQMLETGKQCGGDVEVVRLGKVFDATATPLFDGSGAVRGSVHVLRDITSRKRAEEALRASEERLRLLLESTAEAVYGLDLAGQCTFCNPACLRFLGYKDARELLGRNMHALIHHSRPDGTPYPLEECRIHRAIRQGEGAYVDDESFWRADGSSFSVECWSHPVRRGGEILGAVVAFWDITERKQLEEQLRQAQKMEAVGRLAGGVAHDFNNLLTVMVGFCDLAMPRFGANDPLRGYVEEIRKAADRATALTRQLLAFSRQQVLRPRVLDLNRIVANLHKMLRRLIGEDIEVNTVQQPDLGLVKVDPGQIEQVVLNLAVNSRDAMPQGGKLTIETANVDLDETYTRTHVGVTPGNYVMLGVSDTGCGMDAETQAHLFEPFFTTKEQGKGTGLGLATVYGIVKQSGGHIWVYSEPGQRTTFKIYLPRAEDGTEEAVEREKELTAAAGGSETILLVEDEADVRSLVQGVLESKGYTVLEARHGDLALPIAEQHQGPIHLLLTDVVMPEMSGRELAEHLATVHPETKVLYISGYTGDAILHHGVLEPRAAFLQKPFAPDALARKVREVLDGARDKQA